MPTKRKKLDNPLKRAFRITNSRYLPYTVFLSFFNKADRSKDMLNSFFLYHILFEKCWYLIDVKLYAAHFR